MIKKWLVFICIFSAACKTVDKPEDKKQDEPAALQEKSDFRFSKRGGTDLLEELYSELAEKTPDLKKLEQHIITMQEQEADSLATYHHYHTQNENYYHFANSHLIGIKDSLLRFELKKIIAKSYADYTSKTNSIQQLYADIESDKIRLNELHEALKIIQTIPMIEEYQQKRLPSSNPLLSIKNKYNTTLTKLDSLISK